MQALINLFQQHSSFSGAIAVTLLAMGVTLAILIIIWTVLKAVNFITEDKPKTGTIGSTIIKPSFSDTFTGSKKDSAIVAAITASIQQQSGVKTVKLWGIKAV